MQLSTVQSRPAASTALAILPPSVTTIDPLDDDTAADELVLTTRRAICRVALVATETASRFEREGIGHDPMTWMLAPRALFGGRVAIDACLARDACLRGVLLHGLSLGLDADPDGIDALGGDDDGPPAACMDGPRGPVPAGRGDLPCASVDATHASSAGGRLFTATVVSRDGLGTVQAFHASIAADRSEVSERLRARLGEASADAIIVEGFDGRDPLVDALVAPAVHHTLRMVADDPGSPLAAGLDLNVEQRFLA